MDIGTEIRAEVLRQRRLGRKTSKGEKMSLAAIGRTIDPPVSRTMIYLVVDGVSKSRRVKAAIEKELGSPYWSYDKEARNAS